MQTTVREKSGEFAASPVRMNIQASALGTGVSLGATPMFSTCARWNPLRRSPNSQSSLPVTHTLIWRGGLKSTISSSVTESSISVTARTACTDVLQDGCKPFDVTIQRIFLPHYLAHKLALAPQRIFVLQSSSETAQNLQVAHIFLKLHIVLLPDGPALSSHLPRHHRSSATNLEVFGHKVVANGRSSDRNF